MVGLYELESGGNPTKDMKEVCVISCNHETDLFTPHDLVEEYHRDPEGACGGCSLALKSVSVDKLSMAKKGKPKTERHKQKWLVASTVGCEESFRFARSSYGIAHGLVPLAEVAVKMDESKALTPVECKGQLFCFLPLPIACDVKFLVNGFFDVSTNRRSLKDLQDRSKKNIWNRHLITDCLSRAVLWMFRGLQQCCPGDSLSPAFLESYYNLLPSHDATDDVSKELKPALLKRMRNDSIPFFHVTTKGGQCWKSHHEAHVLNQDFQMKYFSVTLPDMLQVMLEVVGLTVASNVPERVQDVLRDLLQIMSPRQYYEEFFIPRLPAIESCCREKQIIFVLKNMALLSKGDRWLEELLRTSQCIPTAPNDTLVLPTRLIDPSGPLCMLFDECEERFPVSQLRRDEIMSALKSLGMCHDILNVEDVVDRAQSVANPSVLEMEKAQKRSQKLLLYISEHHADVPSLSTIPFIPALQRPEGVSVPWLASDTDSHFSSASEMFKEGFKLVFSHSLILDSSLQRLLIIPSRVLQFQLKPSVEQVVQHLKNLSNWTTRVNTLSQPDKTFLTDTTGTVYMYLENQLKLADDNSLETKIVQCLEVDKNAVVWDENTAVFIKTDSLALRALENVSLAPYRLSANEVPALKQTPRLWRALGIRDMHSHNDCIAVLHEMPTHLSKEDVSIITNILRYLSGETVVREHMLLPTTKQTLLPQSKCYYNDFPWKQQAQGRHLLDKYDFVDTDCVPPKMAKKFGVRPISAIIANPTRLKIKYEEKGQQIPVTRRINRLLEEYSEIDDVFKELIQNADDAEAEVIKFLIDWREHKQQKLLKPEMTPWQGPALYVYNDKTFSDQDFDNICELEGATKRRNPTKIGRFGVGFCAVYHLTDVPSFVSRSQLVILDPQTKFLTDTTSASSPGIRFDFVEEQEELASFYADQMTPYQGVFDCNVLGAQKGFDGTLFRFPFRSEPSDISKRVFQRDQIIQLKEVAMRLTEKLLIFLQHLKKVELYEVCEGQDHTKPSLLVSLERDSSRSVNLLEHFKDAVEYGSSMTHHSTTQEVSLTRSEVVPQKSPKSKKKKGRPSASLRSSSSTWLVASAMGEAGSSSWEHACSAEGRERGDVPLAEVAVPVVAEDSVIPPKLLQAGQVFCFLPLPITISDQKCLINGYFEISKNRRDLAKLQDEQQKNAWNRLLIRDVLVKAYIALLKHLTTAIPDDKKRQDQFLDWYYKLWPLDTARHPLSKELQVAFKEALCESDVPLVWSLANGGKWLPVCEVMCLDESFYKAPLDTVRKDILDTLEQYGYNMAELQKTVRASLCSGPDACLSTVSFKHYCKEILLNNLPHLPHDARDTQLLFILKHLETLNGTEGENWLIELLTSTACIPCKPNGTLNCPTKLVFPEGLLHELYDVDEERFPSKAFCEVKQSLERLGMVVHTLKEEDVVDRAELIHNLSVDKSKQRCESFIQYLTTVHFFGEVKDAPWKWSKHMENTLIAQLSDIAFLLVQQRPSGSTIPWYGDCAWFASPREVYSQSGSNLIFSCMLTTDLPSDHDLEKLFWFKTPNCDEILSHLTQIVQWAEANETEMTSQDHALLDECMPAVYERLSDSFGYAKGKVAPNADAKPQRTSSYQAGPAYLRAPVSTATVKTPEDTVDAASKELNVHVLWNEKGLQDRPFIWQDSNAGKRFHTPAQTVSDSRLKQSYYPYLVKLSTENEQYQQFVKALGVESTLSRQKIADVLKNIAQDFKEMAISDPELMGFIVQVAQQRFHYQYDRKLVFYLPDVKGVMRDTREMAYPEDIAESGFFPEELAEGLTHFVSEHIPKSAAKKLGVQDILADIMRHFQDNEYFKEEDFGQKEEICTRLNNILKQYPADVSIFKEFIQNAEDAMATEIAFVIDHRHSFSDKSMFAHHSTWKSLQAMPALVVFNNRKFQEDDILSIKKLGTGGKADASDKIGRFGVGFNVAYHVTDCPTLVSFGEGGVAENFCVFDPQFKYVPSRHDRKLPGARYRMKNMEGKNSSEHFPDQFAPFLRDVMPKMAESAPGSFADLESEWPHGYSVFCLPLTRAAKHQVYETFSKSEATKLQELLGYPMTVPHLRSLAKDLTEQAPGMLLFLNHLKRISVFEVSDDGKILSPWTVEVEMRHNSDQLRARFATEVTSACTSLKLDGDCRESLPNTFHTTYSVNMITTAGPAVDSDSTPAYKELSDPRQGLVSPPSSMHTASQMSRSSNKVPSNHTDRKTSKCESKQLGEHDMSSPPSLEELGFQQANSSWIISKCFGVSDIPEELLYKGSEERLFPLAVVAIPLPDSSGTYSSTFTGTLYSHLPLPLSTGIPAHINGHFWVDPSRKHLEGTSSTKRKGTPLDQWNETIVQEVVSRAYVDAVTHCKVYVKNSKDSCDCFNRLLLAQPVPFSVLEDFDFSKHVYQLMIERECEILIADAPATEDTTEVKWLALTANADNPKKGWFFVGDPEVRRVLLSIGMKLVSTPLTVNTRTGLLTSPDSEAPVYSGEVTVDLARKYLKKIATCYKDHKDVIVSALVPLLTYVLRGIDSPEQCSAVNGLPLMLTKNNKLRLIDIDYPLYSLEHTDLLPEHCMGKFVSPHLMESAELEDKLLKLYLVTPVSPKYLAKNIDLPNEPVVTFEVCNLELLQRLWNYIATSISSNQDILHYFQSVSIIPTSQSTVVSVGNCKTVLREYGSMTLLRKLKLPVLNFESICIASYCNIVGCVKEMLAKENVTCEVLNVLQHHLALSSDTASIPEATEKEVNEFISFLLKDTHALHSYTATLQKLSIVKVITGEWESLENVGTVYALPHEATPRVGLKDIHLDSSVKIIEIDHQHSAFYELMGVQVLDRWDFYNHVIIPHFQLLCLEAQITHLQQMRMAGELNELLPKLHSIRFIKDDRRDELQLASEYYDPDVEIMKEFLPADVFPPKMWCESNNLQILRLLKLNSIVTDDMWIEFASQVQDCEESAPKRAEMLLQSLRTRVRGVYPIYSVETVEPEETPEHFLQFLRSIADIKFVPYQFPSNVELLFRQLGVTIPVPPSKFVCFRNSLFSREDVTITSFIHEHPSVKISVLLPTSLIYYPNQSQIVRQIVSALGMQLPSVSLVCQNLLRLASCAERCNLSSRHENKDAVERLQQLFTCHYDYFAGIRDEPLLNEISSHLDGGKCLFIPSGLSFMIVKGSSRLAKATTSGKPYSKYLSCVPHYLTLPKYSRFLATIGVKEGILAEHYVCILEALYTSGHTADPNFIEVISALYKDLVRLLEGPEGGDAEAYIEAYEKPIPLPSTNGVLLHADQLVLNDAEWIKERLEQCSDYHFILPPPHKSSGQVSLPPCLGVQPLSELIFEELDKAAVLDRDNRCEAELKAETTAPVVDHEEEEEDELVESCPYSSQFITFIQSEEFGNGLRRMISHRLGGKPLFREHTEAIEAVQSLDVKCVYAIRTHLMHKDSGRIPDTQCDDAPCFLDEKSDTQCLYVCFHPKSEHASNIRLLAMVVGYITRMLGGNVNPMYLREVLESCDPTAVEGVLDVNRVTKYKVQDETDGSMLQYQEGRGTTVEDDLELMLTCNFREGDLVKYCSENSRMVIARVMNVQNSDDESYLFPPTVCLKLTPRSDEELEGKEMNSLLVCKFLSPQQITHLQSLCAVQDDSEQQNSSTELSQEKDVLLELPCSNRQDLQCYFSGISDALEQFGTLQRLFAIERLLFQLHFDCVHRNSQPAAFPDLVEVLKTSFVVHCTDETFIQSLESKISSLLQPLMQPDPIVQPDVPVYQRQSSYTELSSWSIPDLPSTATGTGSRAGGSTYRGQHLPSAPLSAASYVPSRRRRGRQRSRYPVAPAPGTLRGGGTYIWGGGTGRGVQQSIWPEVTEEVTPVPAPTVSLENAYVWLKDACRTVQLVKEMEDVKEVINVPSLEGEEQASVYKYPETLCFYAHEIVLKCLKAVFFAYCGLPDQLVECSNLVQLHQTLMGKLAGNHEVQSVLSETVCSYVHLVSGHGDCCRFPSYDPPALPCDTHSPAVATEVLRSAVCFVEEIQKLAQIRAFFPEGLESFIVVRPDSWTEQEGG